MAIAISSALKDQVLDGILNAVAGINFDGGVLELRTGAAPGPDAADSGTLIASITLPGDAFDPASGGSAAKAGTWEDLSADASGTIAHFRIKQSGDGGGATGASDERIEGTVTGTGGGGDIELDNTSVNSGQSVTISSFSLSI